MIIHHVDAPRRVELLDCVYQTTYPPRASSPLYLFLPASADRPERRYGYLWWSLEYPYNGRTARAFYAGGSGGQAVVVIPQLKLVIATFGANYFSAGTYYVQLDVIPKHVLPAVRPR